MEAFLIAVAVLPSVNAIAVEDPSFFVARTIVYVTVFMLMDVLLIIFAHIKSFVHEPDRKEWSSPHL